MEVNAVAATFIMTLQEMFRILILLLLGFLLRKWNVIPAGACTALSRLVALLLLPALNLYSNMMECKVDSLAAYSQWVLYGAALGVISAAGATLLARYFSLDDDYLQGMYRYGLAVPNTGAVAMPLMLAFFGTAGLFQFSLFQFVIVMITYTWGIAQLLPDKQKPTLAGSLRKCINANSVAMLAGIGLGLVGVTEWMPATVLNTVGDLADCYVVISLIVGGASIAEYPLSRVLGSPKGYWYALLRLLVIPTLFLTVLVAIGAPDMVCIMAALAYASPCGLNVVVYPAAFGKDCSAGVSMVLLSSVGSVFTVPLIYAVVQAVIS